MSERANQFSITLAQLNPTVGDVAGNADKVRAAHARGRADGAAAAPKLAHPITLLRMAYGID